MTLHELPDLEQGTIAEAWRSIPGFKGDYEVSNLGRVRSYLARGGKLRHYKDTPSVKKLRVAKNGYLRVILQEDIGKSRAYTVHALVATAFLGPRPEGCEVAHGDGDKTNARLDNLRYATRSENAQDRRKHGTYPAGEGNGNHKVTDAEVREIRARYRAGEYQASIARAFDISTSQVSNIVRAASWAHLESEAV